MGLGFVVNEVVILEASSSKVELDIDEDFGEEVKDKRFEALDLLLGTAAEREEVAAANSSLGDELAAAKQQVVLEDDNLLLWTELRMVEERDKLEDVQVLLGL